MVLFLPEMRSTTLIQEVRHHGEFSGPILYSVCLKQVDRFCSGGSCSDSRQLEQVRTVCCQDSMKQAAAMTGLLFVLLADPSCSRGSGYIYTSFQKTAKVWWGPWQGGDGAIYSTIDGSGSGYPIAEVNNC